MAGIGRILPVGLLLLAGCAARFPIAGTWRGEREVQARPGADPVVVGNLAKVVLKVQTDGTFELFDEGLPRTGDWNPTGTGFRLSIRRLLNEPAKEPARDLTVVDQNTLRMEGSPPILLRRQ